MVSDLKTIAQKGCKIAAQKKWLFGEFCLSSRIFYICHVDSHFTVSRAGPYTNGLLQTYGSLHCLRQDGRQRDAEVNPQRQRVEVRRDTVEKYIIGM